MRRRGFTLAEILVTLAMIGVIAAMTIPSLINNINDQQNKIAWRKAFGDLSQVTQRIAMENGGTLEGLFNNHNDVRNQFLQYINYTKSCVAGQSNGNCWHTSQKWLNGSTETPNNYAGAILSNGTLLGFWYMSTTCTAASFGASIPACGTVSIDINGFNGPNTFGKDIFAIIIQKDRILPRGTQGDTSAASNNPDHGIGYSALYLYQ